MAPLPKAAGCGCVTATTEQVSQVVKLAAEARVPIVPRGMGSGLAAGSIPMIERRDRGQPDPHEPYPGDRYRERHGTGPKRVLSPQTCKLRSKN